MSIISEDANVPENVEHRSLKNNETNNEKENSYTVNSRNDLMERPSIYDDSSASFALTSSKRRRSFSSKSRVSNPLKKLREGVILGKPAADRSRMIDKTSRGKAFSKSATPNKDRRRRRSYLKFNGDDDSASPIRSGSPKGGKKPVIYLWFESGITFLISIAVQTLSWNYHIFIEENLSKLSCHY